MTPARPRLSAEQIAFDERTHDWQELVSRLRSAPKWSQKDLDQIRRLAAEAARRYDAIGFKDKDRLATKEALQRVALWARRIRWFDFESEPEMLDELCKLVDATIMEDNLATDIEHGDADLGLEPDVLVSLVPRDTRRSLIHAIEDAEQRGDFRAIVRPRLQRIPGIGTATVEAARQGDLRLLRLLFAVNGDPLMALWAERGDELPHLLQFAAAFGTPSAGTAIPNFDLELRIEMLIGERLLRDRRRKGTRGPKMSPADQRQAQKLKEDARNRVPDIEAILRKYYPHKTRREITRMARAIAARQAGLQFQTFDDYCTHPAKQLR